MILYGSSLSPFVRKVLIVAEEKGIALDLRSTGAPDYAPEFLDASPLRKMPALCDGDYRLADSSAIVHYLEALQPEPAMIPAEPRARGTTIWYEEYADTVIMAAGAKIFFNRVVAPRFFGRPGDLDAADRAEKEELPPICDYLESVAPPDEGFLVGDRLTLADIAVAGPFGTLRHTNVGIDPALYPRAAAFVARILARPSFAKWLARETALLERTPQ